MENTFNSVLLKKPEGSWFDQVHGHATSGNMGTLIPVMGLECYPGDKVKLEHELLIRLQPLIAPGMQRFDGFIHNFFIPLRILQQNDLFQKFLAGEAIATPYLDISSSDNSPGSLPDYFGVPVLTGANTLRVNAWVFGAYQRVFYEYYRDQNLSAMTDNDKPYLTAGDNNAQGGMLLTLRNRSYRHDYFTSALPFTQKGTEATISFEFDDVPVKVNRNDAGNTALKWTLADGVTETVVTAQTATEVLQGVDFDTPVGTQVDVTELFAKTSGLDGTSFTINDFRLALATQHWLERMAVGGTRLNEIILAHFGVTSSDARLDRPEYIGGMKTPIVISEVLQTSETTEASPQGNFSGHGMAASYTDNADTYFCEEHGVVISILSVMPIPTYAMGLPRYLDWSVRNERSEWYWPEFANLGEQAIKNREVYANTNATTQEGDWGYTGRFNELRYKPSMVSGLMKTSLSHYTAARLFTSLPTLSEDFLTAVLADTAKMFAVTPTPTEHELIIHVLNKLTMYRLLPKYATPELVG